MDRLARAGWLSHRPERLDGQLRRAAACRPEGWYLYHGGDGQFPGQSADEQIAAHALVAARGQSPPPSSLRRLQWYAWFWLRTEILPSQRYATASGDCRLNPPNLRRSRLGKSVYLKLGRVDNKAHEIVSAVIRTRWDPNQFPKLTHVDGLDAVVAVGAQ